MINSMLGRSCFFAQDSLLKGEMVVVGAEEVEGGEAAGQPGEVLKASGCGPGKK